MAEAAEPQRPVPRAAPGTRLEAIDFLRGVAILEMVATHFSPHLPTALTKIVAYTETAMGLFVLLAGFMVGWLSYPRFLRDPAGETLRLWKRAAQIAVIQFFIILTVNVPLYLLGSGNIAPGKSLGTFILESALFLNQIGIIHILPTFIPMFLVSPGILWLFRHHQKGLLVAMSVALFAWGDFRPYALDIGEPTIFPFILFQIYFVAGCLWGRWALRSQRLGPRQPRRALLVSLAALACTMTLLHGKIFPAWLVSTHPLNTYGLVYHAPLIVTAVLGTLTFWPSIARLTVAGPVSLLGRHAMLAFVVHLYCAKAIGLAGAMLSIPAAIMFLLLAASVVLMVAIADVYERANRSKPSRAVAVLDAVFR